MTVDQGPQPDLDAFRREVVAFLGDHFEPRPGDLDDDRGDIIARTPDGHDLPLARAAELQQLLADAGLAGVHVPEAYGGRGLTADHARVVSDELRRFDTPSLRPLGIGSTLGLATLLAAGTEEQKRRYLPPLLRGDERWCQLFSEPDAGSDLVSLRTRAVRDGGDWVLDGQKVWSSYATTAHFGMVLARTDPDATPPHAGITMFVVPMDTSGVTVRPLVDICGQLHFNEVFLEGVRVADDAVIGAVDDGWRVSQSTLGGERSGYTGGSGGGRRQRQVTVAATEAGRRCDRVARQAIASVVTQERVLEWLRDRFVAGVLAGGHPAAGSMLKLAAGTLEQDAATLIVDLAGAPAQAWDTGSRDGDVASHGVNAARQATIAGGTHEIQHNVLGERVLGLPKEPR